MSTLASQYRHLSAADADVLLHFAALPATVIDADLIAAVCQMPWRDADHRLNQLLVLDVLEDATDPRGSAPTLCRIPPGIRPLLRQRAVAELGETSRTQALRRLCDWYLLAASAAERALNPDRPRLTTRPTTQQRDVLPVPLCAAGDVVTAQQWLHIHREGLLAAVHVARARQWHTLTWQLTDALWPLLSRWCATREWTEIERLGQAAAQQCGSAAGQRRLLNSGARALYEDGRPEEALDWYGRALGSARRDDDPYEVLQALTGLGEGHRLAGRPEKAKLFLLEVSEIHKRQRNSVEVALAYVALGDVDICLGHHQNASAFLGTALTDLIVSGEMYRVAQAKTVMARAQMHLDRAPTAHDLLVQALEELDFVPEDPWTVYGRQLLADLDHLHAGSAREAGASPAPAVLVPALEPW